MLYCVQKRGFPFVVNGCSKVLYGRTVSTAKKASSASSFARDASDTVFAALKQADAAIIAGVLENAAVFPVAREIGAGGGSRSKTGKIARRAKLDARVGHKMFLNLFQHRSDLRFACYARPAQTS